MNQEIIIDQEVLTKPSKKIHTNEWDKVFKKLEKAFDFKTMAGLSAIQLGILKNAFIIKLADGIIMKFANLRIEPIESEGMEKSEEGCLSIPDRKFSVDRFRIIRCFDDINGLRTFVGEAAKVVQHEYDHCQGKTLLQTGTEIVKEKNGN